MVKKEYSSTEKNVISLKSIVIPCILMFGVIFYSIFGGMIKRLKMDSSIDVYKVEVNYISSNKGLGHYAARYYYVVDNVDYQYCHKLRTSIPLFDIKFSDVSSSQGDFFTMTMKDTTLYYDSSNPVNAVAKYETKLHFYDIFVILFVSVIIYLTNKKVIIK